MKHSVCRSMDPFEIQSRYSSEDYSFFSFKESSFCLDDFEPFIDKLPRREKDLIEMYYKRQKKQKEIAEFFNVTQGAVSHRLSRARKRLKFLRDMPKATGNLEEDLSTHFTDFEIDIIKYMIETTCQSKTADILNKKHGLKGKEKMTQVKVRHKFDRAISKINNLKKKNPELNVYFELTKYVQKNPYMLHEVILPHFDRGYKVNYKGVF